MTASQLLQEYLSHFSLRADSRLIVTASKLLQEYLSHFSLRVDSSVSSPGPSCSKLTTSLVNVSLKFQTLIS